jgi:hypothetical protein
MNLTEDNLNIDMLNKNITLTKEQHNTRWGTYAMRISNSPTFNNPFVQKMIDIYMKGKYIEVSKKDISNLSKDKLIKKCLIKFPHLTISNLKRVRRTKLLELIKRDES